MPLQFHLLRDIRVQLQSHCPSRRQKKLSQDLQSGSYHTIVQSHRLFQAILIAYFYRLPSLESILSRCQRLVQTAHKSTLHKALKRRGCLRFVKEIYSHLIESSAEEQSPLVAIDSMAVTLPKTQRHRCKRMNNNTVGGGALIAFCLDTDERKLTPVRVLKTIAGPWNDSYRIRDVELIANGPIYLMDRGFVAYRNFEIWLEQSVHFIVRGKHNELFYDTKKVLLRKPRPLGQSAMLIEDSLVVLGIAANSKKKGRPYLRLLRRQNQKGMEIILFTDLFDVPAEQVFAMYRRRWEIETFFRHLKDYLGMGHLYSFDQRGIEFLFYSAIILATLIMQAGSNCGGKTVEQMNQLLNALREGAGLDKKWSRNTIVRGRRKAKKQGAKSKPGKRGNW